MTYEDMIGRSIDCTKFPNVDFFTLVDECCRHRVGKAAMLTGIRNYIGTDNVTQASIIFIPNSLYLILKYATDNINGEERFNTYFLDREIITEDAVLSLSKYLESNKLASFVVRRQRV